MEIIIVSALGFRSERSSFWEPFSTLPVNVPVGVIAYLASQLGIADPQCIVRYAERIQTQQDHAQEIRQHYSYKEFSDRQGGFALMRFLYARAWVGTERPSVLFDLATAWLLDKKVLLPGVTTLTRLISSIRERVAERLWQRLSAVVTPEQRTDLEGLLARAGTSRISNLERLRRAPSRASAPVLVQALARLTEARQLDVGPHELGNVPASRIKALAQYAVTTKAQNGVPVATGQKPTLSLKHCWLAERTPWLLIECSLCLKMVFPIAIQAVEKGRNAWSHCVCSLKMEYNNARLRFAGS